jgi:hypothetical protein
MVSSRLSSFSVRVDHDTEDAEDLEVQLDFQQQLTPSEQDKLQEVVYEWFVEAYDRNKVESIDESIAWGEQPTVASLRIDVGESVRAVLKFLYELYSDAHEIAALREVRVSADP